MENRGTTEAEKKDYALESDVGSSSFEKDILIPSPEMMEAISQSYFPDKESLMVTCQYIAMLEEIGLEDEKKQALYVINGQGAIGARKLNSAVQAHGLLYWPENATKDEKNYLSKQFGKQRERSDEEETERAQR